MRARDGRPCVRRARRIDAVHAKHRRGIEHVAGAVAEFVRHAGERGEIAVAGTIDEDARAHRATPRARLQDQRVDRLRVMHGDADSERVKQRLGAARGKKIVGGDLVGGIVISLRHALAAEQHMRRVQAAEPVDAAEKVVGDAMHDLAQLAMHVGVQAAEVRYSRSGAHAAEKAVALDDERGEPGAGGDRGSGDPRRSAAEHDDIVLAEERRLARGFFDGADVRHCYHWAAKKPDH